MSDCACTNEPDTSAEDLHLDIVDAFVATEVTHDHKIDTKLGYIPHFSAFNEEHVKTALRNANRLSELDHQEMMQQLSDLKNIHPHSTYPDYLARIALSYHPATKNKVLPPPHQVLAKIFFDQDTLSGKSVGSPNVLDPESRLNWWRTDPGLNEHHCFWHIYNPCSPDPKHKIFHVKPRQGELFAYMHEQMLARYNFERLAVGLAPVAPYGPGQGWENPLREGVNSKLAGFSPRASMMSIPNYVTFYGRQIFSSDMERNLHRLQISIARNYLEGTNGEKVELTMHHLGCTVEADEGSANRKLYGDLHNRGHLVIGSINDPDGRYGTNPGPMINTATACRDPVFFRWHKFVDNIFETFRKTQKPYAKETLTMDKVKLLKVSVTSDTDQNSDKGPVVNHLKTKMKEETFIVKIDKKMKSLKKQVVDYDPFIYNFRVECETDVTVVFRVFLAPQVDEKASGDLNSRRNDFVEMDSFVQKLDKNTEFVVRKSVDSSVLMDVIKKWFHDDIEDPSDEANFKTYCGCGWPRNMLVPRGTPEGMKADLFVMVTNWEDDAVNPDVRITGNVAYCGKSGKPYPDKRPMGFPFDRDIQITDDAQTNTLEKLVEEVPNSTKAGVVIKFTPPNQD